MIRIGARGISAGWERESGHLPCLTIGGAQVLHAAPWRETPEIQADTTIPLVDRRLGGSFVCAPFGQDDVDGEAPHGRGANGPWRVRRQSPGAIVATCALSRGRVTARIAVRDDHPVLYQTHMLDLTAPCTFALHPILYMAAGGWISAAPHKAALTWEGEAPVFASQNRSETYDLPTPDGGMRDLRALPEETCEDFVTLVTGVAGLGWTAVARRAEGDTILFLRDTRHLPVTNLWFSNGARQGAPWNGRYQGVLGVEDAICAGAEGFAAALSGSSRVAGEGVPTALGVGRHVIASAIVRVVGTAPLCDVRLGDGALSLETEGGPMDVPFDDGHLT